MTGPDDPGLFVTSSRSCTWDAALSFVGDQARTGPLTIILDEFQWLKYAQQALDSIIQRHWDRWDREALLHRWAVLGGTPQYQVKETDAGLRPRRRYTVGDGRVGARAAALSLARSLFGNSGSSR